MDPWAINRMDPWAFNRTRYCTKTNGILTYITGDHYPSAIRDFNTAGLMPLLQENLAKSHYTSPTPVQKRCLPIVMSGRDLIACAQTGSGKTAAFLLPILQKLMESQDDSHAGEMVQADNHTGEMIQAPQCLVITPTRELVMQIKDEAEKLSMGSLVKYGVPYNGTLDNMQKGCNVLIATPGRLMDFVDNGQVIFENLKYLVLDEADRLLNMGFLPDIQRVMHTSTMPAKGERQTLMFTVNEIKTTEQIFMEFLNESYLFVQLCRTGGPFEYAAE